MRRNSMSKRCHMWFLFILGSWKPLVNIFSLTSNRRKEDPVIGRFTKKTISVYQNIRTDISEPKCVDPDQTDCFPFRLFRHD